MPKSFLDGKEISLFDLIEFDELSEPAVSVSGRARIYYDALEGKLKVSEDGGAWQDLVSNVIDETDPVFTSSPAGGITADDISNWNDAFGWGDHGDAGYLTSETDPVFTLSPAFGIENGDITNWDTAYGWGNHADAGYYSTDQTIPQTVLGTPTFPKLVVDSTSILSTTGVDIGAVANVVWEGTSDANFRNIYGLFGMARANSNYDIRAVYGSLYGSINSGAGNITDLVGMAMYIGGDNGSITNATALKTMFSGDSASAGIGCDVGTYCGIKDVSFYNYCTIGDYYGMYLTCPEDYSEVGTIDNHYGIYVEDVNKGGILNYAIYTNSGIIHFGDDVEMTDDATIDGIDISTIPSTFFKVNQTTPQNITVEEDVTIDSLDVTINFDYLPFNILGIVDVHIPVIKGVVYTDDGETVAQLGGVGFNNRVFVLDYEGSDTSEIIFSKSDFTNSASIVADFTKNYFVFDWSLVCDTGYDIGTFDYPWNSGFFEGTVYTHDCIQDGEHRSYGHQFHTYIATSDYTANSNNDVIVCNSSGNITITLPQATGSGRKYDIKQVNTGTVTIEGDGSDTIDGDANKSIAVQYTSYTVVDYANGKWAII